MWSRASLRGRRRGRGEPDPRLRDRRRRRSDPLRDHRPTRSRTRRRARSFRVDGGGRPRAHARLEWRRGPGGRSAWGRRQSPPRRQGAGRSRGRRGRGGRGRAPGGARDDSRRERRVPQWPWRGQRARAPDRARRGGGRWQRDVAPDSPFRVQPGGGPLLDEHASGGRSSSRGRSAPRAPRRPAHRSPGSRFVCSKRERRPGAWSRLPMRSPTPGATPFGATPSRSCASRGATG